MAELADAIVLFGATGDLARRMVLPSLYFLDADGHLPVELKVVGSARTELTRDAFIKSVREILDARPEEIDDGVWKRFAERLDYVAGDATTKAGAKEIAPHLRGFNRPVYFLAVSPSLYGGIATALESADLA